jgi:predicted dehydrogenase
MKNMDRRNFTKLSALTLAATRLPAFAEGIAQTSSPTGMPTLARPVGFAPVGLGVISDIFMKACAQTPNAKITGLVTGHPHEKAPKYAQQFDVPQSSIYTYETFDHIRDNPAIEAVYIGLPNSMHCEYTVRAAEAGKHVLCEKPMAISSAECRRMIDACRKANVKLMIAYRIHYDPTWLHIRKLVHDGELGEIRGYQGSFFGPKQQGEWRLNRKLAGGGSLMDLGIYPMNAIRWISGEEPADFRAFVSTMQ